MVYLDKCNANDKNSAMEWERWPLKGFPEKIGLNWNFRVE